MLHKLVIFAHGIFIFCRRISTFGRGIGQKNAAEFYFFSCGIPSACLINKCTTIHQGINNFHIRPFSLVLAWVTRGMIDMIYKIQRVNFCYFYVSTLNLYINFETPTPGPSSVALSTSQHQGVSCNIWWCGKGSCSY